MKTLTKLLGLTLVVTLTACGGEPDEPTNEPDAITKEEARALGGKSDGIDWCDYLGWYGDGICDDFCAEPDPDCGPDTCTSDADCPDGYCEHYATCLAIGCPPPPPPQCVAADCDDGSRLHPLCDQRPVCEDGEVSAVINGCFQCVDARTCEAPAPPSCDDGTPALCTVEPPTCADDEVVAVINHCYQCVDPNTCEAPAPSCDDGSQLHPLCDIVPACENGTTPAVINGCFECVDPNTCAPAEGRMCGGIAGLQCPDGQVCQMDAGMCNVSDAAGTCVFGGDVCPAVYDPVCGCDGNTYSNSCVATSVGVSIDHDGECLPPDTGGDCGGIAGLTCDRGEYCAYEADAMCGAADQLGTCTPRPEACITLYDPVCGCDGNTYSNGCFAASAGVSVAADGACAP